MDNNSYFTDLQKKKIIEYVMDNWISRYFGVVIISKREEFPKMTTVYSDVPARSNAFSSQIETMAIKKAEASNWLKKLEDGLNNLPQFHQEIIRKKYLSLDSFGRRNKDITIYNELGIGKTQYYSLKKEALFWLGMLLITKEQLIKVLENHEEDLK